MKKFNVVITRQDEYEIEVDENVWNEEALAAWSESFAQVDDQWDVAKDLSERILRQGHDEFIEGYGNLAVFGTNGNQYGSVSRGTCPGIKVTLLEYDENYNTEITELP